MNKGHKYERRCARKLKRRGFTRVSMTKASGDQGVDILAHAGGKKYAIQCKYYASPVGNDAVQQAYTGARFYGCDIPVVMTNSTFTRSAVQAAEATGVLLWEGDRVGFRCPLYLRPLRFLGFSAMLLAALVAVSVWWPGGAAWPTMRLIEAGMLAAGGLFSVLQRSYPQIGPVSCLAYTACFGLHTVVERLSQRPFDPRWLVAAGLGLYTLLCGWLWARPGAGEETRDEDE